MPTTVRRFSGRPGAPRDEDDVRRVGVDVRRHPARRERLHDRVLHDAAQLQRRRLEILRRPEVNREPQASRGGESIILAESWQKLLEQRLEPHGCT